MPKTQGIGLNPDHTNVNTPSLMAVWRQLTSTYGDAVRAVGLFSLVINLLMLVPSLYMMQVYDRVLASRNDGTLWLLTFILAFLLALEGLLEWMRSQILGRLFLNIELKVAKPLFDMGYAQHLSGEGQMSKSMSDLAQVRQFATSKGLVALFDLPWLPIYLIASALISPWIGLFGLFATLLLMALAWYNETSTGELHVNASRMGQNAQQWAEASSRNAEVVQAMGMLGALRSRWMIRQQAHLALLSQAQEKVAAIGGVSKFARTLLQSLILGLGAYLVLADQMTSGGMIAASILLGRALAPVDMAIGHWKSFVTARDAYGRLRRLLSKPQVLAPQVRLPTPQGHVHVQQLVVSAPARKEPILKGLSFEVKPSQVVAIVGASGSGKSTLARALVGIWPPTSGAVRLDGADVSTWHREDIGQHLGYLPQDVELLEGTVAENIARFGVLDSDAIVLAAKRAGVHELILALPKGYETLLGRGSQEAVQLSGGQRQRVALARALYGDPALVVLDEPNANLDDIGDMALAKALLDLKNRGRTVFVVTHRANLLNQSDAIIVMSEGRIQTMGASADILRVAQPPKSHQQPPASPSPLNPHGLPTAAPLPPASEART